MSPCNSDPHHRALCRSVRLHKQKKMIKLVRASFLLLVSFTLFAQPGDVSLFGPVPAAPSVSAVVVGNPGITPYDYYVIANYGGGAVVSTPAFVPNAP